MSEKYTYNIKNCHTAKITISEAGTVSYGTPVALPGASQIALPPVGAVKKVYADGKVYAMISPKKGYDGSISVYAIPGSFREDYLGEVLDSNGVYVEKTGVTQNAFALMFEMDTDTAETNRCVLLNVYAGRPDISSKTSEDDEDPQPFEIPITAAPADDTGITKMSVVGDSTDDTWSAWFSSVYTYSAAAQYKVSVLVQVGTTPVADAFVYCGGKVARTNSTGYAYFMLPNGTYDVMAADESNTPATDSVTVSSDAASATLTLT